MGSAASGAGVSAHGDGLLVLLDVLEESDGALELPAVDGLGSLTAVLETAAEVAAPRASALCGLNLGGGVTDLFSSHRQSSYLLYKCVYSVGFVCVMMLASTRQISN